jgi:Eukaryotic initiation factor 4E
MASTVSSVVATAAESSFRFPSDQRWSLYFHDTGDNKWNAKSFEMLDSFISFEELWGAMKSFEDRFARGMYFLMKGVPEVVGEDTKWEKGNHAPLWEHKYNVYGGAYCVKVTHDALNIYQHYAAAAILGELTTNPLNSIIGVTISPKKNFFIMKLWNLSADKFKDPRDIKLLVPGLKVEDILYRPHGDARM